MRKFVLVLAGAFLFASTPGAVQAQTLPFDPAVRKGTLPNGLTYYIRENKTPANRAELYLVNKVGSILEDESQLGLAHFVEHMAFNGTRDFPKNSLIDYLQKAGVKFGADINAYTSFDETVYQLPIPTDTAGLLEKGLDILLNWAGYVSFDKEEVDAERGVILEEARLRGKNAQERMQNQALPVLFNHSRYAERIPIGKEEILKTFSLETIKKFYTDWYRPDLQAVIAVGDFDADQVEAWIKQKFSALKNPASPRPRTKYEVTPHEGIIAKLITDKEFPYTVVQMVTKAPNTPVTTEEGLKEQIRIELFNAMLNARLQEKTRKPDAPIFFAQSSITPFIAGIKAYLAIAVVKNDGLDKTIELLKEETERVKRFGFTASELDRAKKELLSQRESIYKEKDKTKSVNYVSAYQSHFLQGNAVPGSEYVYQFYVKEVPNVKAAEVTELIKNFNTSENTVVLVQAPAKDSAKLPSDQQLLAMSAKAVGQIAAYEDAATDKPLLAKKPTPGKLTSTTPYPEVGAEKLVFNNGVTVWLKPTDFKNDEIRFTSFGFGGTSLLANDKLALINMGEEVMDRSGVSEFNETTLQKMLAGKNVSVGSYVGETAEGVSGFSTPADLETALQLVHLYYTQPARDSIAFETTKSEFKELVKNKGLSPTEVFQDTVSAVMSNYNPRRMSPDAANMDKMLQSLKLNEIHEFYKKRFSNAGDDIFVFVGNFEREKLLPLLETYLGSLPSTKQKEMYRNLGIKPMAGKQRKTVYKGQEEKSLVEIYYHGAFEWNEQNALLMDAFAEVLQIKLIERLREKEGGVYSPSVSASYSKIPEARFSLNISFGCAPENVEKLIAATKDEIEKLRKNGPSEEDLAKFKAEEKRAFELQLKENGFWLNYLLSQARNNEPVKDQKLKYQAIDAISIAQVKSFATKFISEKAVAEIVLMPEKAK
jgi:zinc protease